MVCLYLSPTLRTSFLDISFTGFNGKNGKISGGKKTFGGMLCVTDFCLSFFPYPVFPFFFLLFLASKTTKNKLNTGIINSITGNAFLG